jgi:mono/diheme cytochrome c family protein
MRRMARKRRWSDATWEAAAIMIVIALVVGAVFLGFFLGRDTKHTSASGTTTSASTTVDPQVASGGHLFVQFACAQCHGEQGQGGISPVVPSLSTVGKTLTPAQLRHIINHGLGESANPKVPYMPVWGAVISDTQVNDLVAYIRAGLPAVPTATPPETPTGQGLAVEGSVLYVRYGCINCHGPNGLGGVPNPLSADKVIPPLSGPGFHHDFPTDQSIIDVIKSGSVIGQAPIVSMPHWGGIIPDAQLQALVAYLKTLKTVR